MYTCTCLIDTPVITSQSRKLLPLDGAVLIKILRSTCLSYLLLLLLPWHLKVSIMLLSFQVQCCVNGKSKNYVSFTYSYTSGTGRRRQATRRARFFWNYYWTVWSFSVDHIIHWLSRAHAFLSSSFLTYTSLPSTHLRFICPLLVMFFITFHRGTQTRTSAKCFAWTWPQFVNILPLAHPLCWYNDHLTVKSKARRKLGRRQQRGQQHWSNYVSFSPSILTLMKSLIIRGEGGEGRTGVRNVRCSFILLSEMNGRSGKNNVEIKPGQQVCVVFFSSFFILLALQFAVTEEAVKRAKSLRCRWMSEEKAREGGRARCIAR